jgi:hypothetical protein
MKGTTILGALSFFGLHLLLVTTPVFLSGANGETQGWLTYFADFPLLVGMLALGIADSRTNYLLIAYVLGPVMYAAIGALIGSAVGRVVSARASGTRKEGR